MFATVLFTLLTVLSIIPGFWIGLFVSAVIATVFGGVAKTGPQVAAGLFVVIVQWVVHLLLLAWFVTSAVRGWVAIF